jgi:hypothetical protein
MSGAKKPPLTQRALLFLLLLPLCACASRAPRSTRITGGDYEVLIPEIVSQLASSDFLRDRGPESPPIIVTTERVRNLTTDLMPVAEQWMLVNRVQTSLPLLELAKQKNVRFQIPPERVELLRAKGFEVGGRGTPGYRAPTHVMTAEFRSATRVGRLQGRLSDVRAEYYDMEFQIFDVNTRELAWSGACAFHREARGKLID